MTVAVSVSSPCTAISAHAGALEQAAAADVLIFDVDGVLVDVNRSLRLVSCEAAQFYLTRVLHWQTKTYYVLPRDIALFKSAGGFNDDWDLTRALVLLYLVKAHKLAATHAASLRRASPTIAQVTRSLRASAGGYPGLQRMLLDPLGADARAAILGKWDTEFIARIFKEHFAGARFCREFYGFEPEYYLGPAYIDRDRPLVDPALLACASWKIGLYTGRTLAEAKHAISLIGAGHLINWEHVVTADDSIYKPDPRGLEILAQRMGFRSAVFFGDMPDDAEAVRRYCRAGVPTPAAAGVAQPPCGLRSLGEVGSAVTPAPSPLVGEGRVGGNAPRRPEILFAYVRSGRRADLWAVPDAHIETPSVNILLRAILRRRGK